MELTHLGSEASNYTLCTTTANQISNINNLKTTTTPYERHLSVNL